MSMYDSDNLPNSMGTVSPLPDDLFNTVQNLFLTSQKDGIEVAREAKVAFIYDRKGYIALDSITDPRNMAYGANDDDVVVQLTLRIRHNPISPVNAFQNLISTIKERQDLELKLQLFEEVKALTAAINDASTLLAEKEEKLSQLGVQR